MTEPADSGSHLTRGHPEWGWEFHCEDFVFARLDEEHAEAEALAGADRQAALNRVSSLRRAAAWHSAYVDGEGLSWARCYTCEPSHGFPCTTMRNLASVWQAHPDFRPGWADNGDFLADVITHGGFRRAFEAKRGGGPTG